MQRHILAILRLVFLTVMAIFLVAPLVVVTGVSLNSTRRMSFPPEALSLTWYTTFLGDAAWRGAFETSLIIASLAAVTAVSIALPLAYAVWRFNSRVAKVLSGLAVLPFMLPAVVLSVVFLIFWDWIGHPGRIEDVILSHAAAFLAVPVVTIGLGLSLIETPLVEAARTLGADEGAVFRTIILPILLPYIVSGLAFVFVLSLNEYIIAYMVAGFSVETLPIRVFNSLRLGFEPTMCVGATLFMGVTTGAFLLIATVGDLPQLLGADRSRG